MAKRTALARLKNKLQIEEDRMDKYLSFYYENKELDPEDMAMLDRYRKAWSWLSMGRPFDVVLAMLTKEYAIQDRQARNIISEAVYLHGHTSQLDKAGKKVASANFYRMVANLAVFEKQFEAASRAWEKADKLEGLMDEEEVGLDPEDFMKPGKFIFINNVNILKQANKDVEDDE